MCLAVYRVVKRLSPLSQHVEWSSAVADMPLILVHTSSAVGKFRRGAKLYNSQRSFVVIVHSFAEGTFFLLPLDRLDPVPDTAAAAATFANTSTNAASTGININSINNGVSTALQPAAPLTCCMHRLESAIATFLQCYQSVPRTLSRCMLGAPRPADDRDHNVGAHLCALVQDTYQALLAEPRTSAFVVYHSNSCPACPCAVRVTEMICAFLQEAAQRFRVEHPWQEPGGGGGGGGGGEADTAAAADAGTPTSINNNGNNARRGFFSVPCRDDAASTLSASCVKNGVVAFSSDPRGPVLVVGALTIEENELDFSLFPELTVPHYRYFPAGAAKAARFQVVQREQRHPGHLLDRIRQCVLEAHADGGALDDGSGAAKAHRDAIDAVFAAAALLIDSCYAALMSTKGGCGPADAATANAGGECAGDASSGGGGVGGGEGGAGGEGLLTPSTRFPVDPASGRSHVVQPAITGGERRVRTDDAAPAA